MSDETDREASAGRDVILDRLREDLMGPRKPLEVLSARPSDIYVTGILWPRNLAMDEDDNTRLGADGQSDAEGASDGEAEQVSTSAMRRPATAGISFAVAASASPLLNIEIEFATYKLETHEGEDGPLESEWHRQPFRASLESVILTSASPIALSEYGGPEGVYAYIRSVPAGTGWLATVMLVNDAAPAIDRDEIEAATLFQTSIIVRPGAGTQLIARPSRRIAIDEDDQSAALLYRKACEYGVGHTCAADWERNNSQRTDSVEGQAIGWVATNWIPSTIVPAVDPGGHPLFKDLQTRDGSNPFSAEWLSRAPGAELCEGLEQIIAAYRTWIEEQQNRIGDLPEEFREIAARNLAECEQVAARMHAGAKTVAEDEGIARCFRLANLAMLTQFQWDPNNPDGAALCWHPFQLGFLLLTLASVARPGHPDRALMDLLWFPTGGGKTEAYLGLIAFNAFHRRVRSSTADDGAGLASIMRYTLRLLTAQQFTRASAVIFACEAIRRGAIQTPDASPSLGATPFSIGLWIGGDASPNRRAEAYASLNGAADKASPKQLTHCPACHGKVAWSQTGRSDPVRASCLNKSCVLFHPNTPLPVWTVDDDIYAFKPTLIIATVDKFAQIVRRKEITSLFGVDGSTPPPDLIIQDELHLISGPLGTIAGLYETALDLMLSENGFRPKVIGSTATIRRASEQVKALFERGTCQFPPSGIDYEDSGFAIIDHELPGRCYAGIASAGRSAKFTLQATAASLLQSGEAAFHSDEKRDPYSTLVSYYNSLRELGGSLVLMQDDVHDSLRTLADLRGESARIPEEIQELTSRRTQDEVNKMLDLLAVHSGDPAAVDVVLATNMLSVGVNIPRLGLMLVYGQPKGIAEYIQATSRVGRGKVPGLIVSVFNSAKARDRSHFETFLTWHATLYRDVEATSVTPFASRARDRALHAALVTAVRHLAPSMLNTPRLTPEAETAASRLIDKIASRAEDIDPLETAVRDELLDRLESWLARNPAVYWNDRQPKQSLLQSAEHAATQKALGRSPGDAWPTMNNMRNVEPGTPFRLADRLRARSDGADDAQ